MARIFVSYSRADRQFIDQFIPLIRRVYGSDSLWFDEDIHGGFDWWQSILDEIGKSDLFIYLISNESVESPYCQAEMREALRLNKRILPIIVRRLKPPYPGNIDPDLGAFLRKTQYVDLSVGFHDPNVLSTLYAALTHLLDHTPPQLSIPSPPISTPEPIVTDKKKSRRALNLIYIVRGFVLFGGITILLIGLLQSATPPFDPLITIASTQYFTETYTPPPAVSPTSISTLTATPTLSPEQIALIPIAHNNGWTLVEDKFNDIDMVLVPAGCFMMGRQDGLQREQPTEEFCFGIGEDNLKPFWMSKFEISNAQYRQFIEVGGYDDMQYWTEHGWEVKRANGWKQPGYWTNNAYNNAQQPVVSVSWYEALAVHLTF